MGGPRPPAQQRALPGDRHHQLPWILTHLVASDLDLFETEWPEAPPTTRWLVEVSLGRGSDLALDPERDLPRPGTGSLSFGIFRSAF